MKKILPALALLTLTMTACGSTSPHTSQSTTRAVTVPQTPASAPAAHRLGDTVNLTGADGTPIKAILTGVYYGNAHAKTYTGPDKYAVALAFTLIAMQHTDHLPAPIDGHDFTWTNGTEQRAAVDATGTPWNGCTNAYLPSATLTVGQPHQAIVDLTTPATGGTLTWNDEAGPVQWEMPDKSTGTGTEPASTYETRYC